MRGKRGGRHGAKGMRGKGDKGHRGGGDHGAMMKQVDTNGDQMISKAEFTAAAMARFDKIDANKDGKITKDERQAQRVERRANRDKRGG